MSNKYKMRRFKCLGCGEEVERRRSASKTQYCSLDCYRSSGRPNRKTGKAVNCAFCGKATYKPLYQLNHKNNFCSSHCANAYQGRNKVDFICKVCGNKFRWSASRLTTNNPIYCSMDCRNADTEHMVNCGLTSTIRQQKKRGLNKLELAGRLILRDMGLDFNEQILMFDKFLADVLIKGRKLIIQWDGEYWHQKPKRKALDNSQDAYLGKCGYTVLRITDEQIKNELGVVYANIRRAIQSVT